MNGRQKSIVLAGVVVVALMLLVPPWERRTPGMKVDEFFMPGRSIPLGYATIAAPPHPLAEVNTTRLVGQCAFVAVLAFGGFVLLGHKK